MTATRSTSPDAVNARDDAVEELVRKGLRASDIAAALGITERTVQRAKKRRKLVRPHPPPLSEFEIAEARRLLEEGAPYGEVAETLGRNASNISRRFRGMSKCTPREGFEIKMMMRMLEAL